ncbi:MAG: hypothetical protein CMC82_10220 [Flavobacteriaceae bacterium]|nr:hypothetical protein [Flavobacteriaceae bacterium]|tara:strand:- start:1114 stop:1422 length:309 start_codon:yes stop_codon:yes gene_type:complete
MAKEFEVRNAEEFETMIREGDLRISDAIVSTILKNLKSKKRHHHALSVITLEDDAIYDISIDKKDFYTTLVENLSKYEREERYEECVKIKGAIDYLKSKNDK